MTLTWILSPPLKDFRGDSPCWNEIRVLLITLVKQNGNTETAGLKKPELMHCCYKKKDKHSSVDRLKIISF